MQFALGKKYPLENEGQVKIAVDFFDSFLPRFNYEERVEIAGNIEKRAAELGVDVRRDWIDNYSRALMRPASYSPDFERNMDIRKEACVQLKNKVDMRGHSLYTSSMVEKLAASKSEIPCVAMVKAVAELDKMAGLAGRYDADIPDPVITVFGSLVNPRYDEVKVAGDLTNYDLKNMVRNDRAMEKVASITSKEFAESFKKDPAGAFNSMKANNQMAFLEKTAFIRQPSVKGGSMRTPVKSTAPAAPLPSEGLGRMPKK